MTLTVPPSMYILGGTLMLLIAKVRRAENERGIGAFGSAKEYTSC